MTTADLDLGLQYADTMNLARGILDSAEAVLTAQADMERGRLAVQYGFDLDRDVAALLEPWERLIHARAAAEAWCWAYLSRGYDRPPPFPLTPAECPT